MRLAAFLALLIAVPLAAPLGLLARDPPRLEQLDGGAAPIQELRHIVCPLLLAGFARAALAVAVLLLGEVSAGKLVAVPGMPSYATVFFTQMHHGVTNELAARCVLLLLAVAAGAAGVAL